VHIIFKDGNVIVLKKGHCISRSHDLPWVHDPII
jgi:hypothetical protein